jgi:hypothetical protein
VDRKDKALFFKGPNSQSPDACACFDVLPSAAVSRCVLSITPTKYGNMGDDRAVATASGAMPMGGFPECDLIRRRRVERQAETIRDFLDHFKWIPCRIVKSIHYHRL